MQLSSRIKAAAAGLSLALLPVAAIGQAPPDIAAAPQQGAPVPQAWQGRQGPAVGRIGPHETVQGIVAEVFGRNFVLQTPSGRFLVETGPPHAGPVNVRQGDNVQILGERRDNRIEAFSIGRGDGSVTQLQHGPASKGGDQGEARGRDGDDRGRGEGGERRAEITWREAVQLLAGLEAQGYRDIREVDLKRRHVEVEARSPRGERVDVRIFRDGRVEEERD